MTTTYDPGHPAYFDEADVRTELSRVFDVCEGCRICTDFCGSFPSLFAMLDDMIDTRADLGLPGRAGGLTPAQQDLVVDECFQCKLWAGNEEVSTAVTSRLIDAIDAVGSGAELDATLVAGECLLTNAAIAERFGTEVLHPLELVVRAYRAALVPLDEL